LNERHTLKSYLCLYFALVLIGFSVLKAKAQVVFEQIRNTDPVTYYVNNPYGDQALFTWTITGGTLVGHSSPYTANGADTVEVKWNDTNRNSANYGSLTVSEIVKWHDGSTCPSEEEKINVESWVQPKAQTDTSGILMCPGEPFVIRVYFEGKPGYRYKWKLYDLENPAIPVEDHTDVFISSINSFADIDIPALENSVSTEKLYEFEITDVQDGFADGMPGDVSSARVTIFVQPKTAAGILKSNNHLIRR
jgi:hypothetical protein